MEIPKHIVDVNFGEDFAGNPIDSDNPFEIRIRALSPELTPIERVRHLKPILENMKDLPEAECDAIVRLIGDHFELDHHALGSIRKDLKHYRKLASAASPTPVPSQSEVIRKLERRQSTKIISPAQDFRDGVMYFGVQVDGEPYLLTSQRQIIGFGEARNCGLVLRGDNIDSSRFSPAGIIRFLEGSYELSIPGLYKRIYDYVRRFIVFTDDRLAVYLSLWVMGTYVHKIFSYYPYVWLNAEKASGKSLLMKVLSRIAFNGDVLINPTEAVIFRDVATNSISMFIDEVEQLSKQDKEAHRALISLLNSGFERGGYVKRVERSTKGSFVLRSYSAYSPKMFAGINDLDDVLVDRTVSVRLLRKKQDENVDRFRDSDAILRLQQEIRDDCYVFALTCGADLARLYHESDNEKRGLAHLTNRELDIWEPIMLLADIIDTGLGGNEVVGAMIELSSDSAKEKQEVSETENETYKVLTVVKAMLSELTPLESTDHDKTYTTDSVFEYFQGTDEFSWLQSKNKSYLTRRLKKIRVRRGQQRVTGKNTRTYIVNLATFEDLCERFKI